MFNAEERAASKELAGLDLEQSWPVRFGPLFFVVLFVFAAAAAFIAAERYRPHGSNINGANVSTVVLGIGAFLIGYHQWRSAKQETSMERFYDRLKTANEARSELREDEHRIAPMDMYVYTELDNLEYVVQKYKLGYMSAQQALRGVKTFRSRLEGVTGFGNALRARIEFLHSDGYYADTEALVRNLLKQRSRARAGRTT
jgi:hypothetical protein